jgi:tRNA (cytidine/uridine-2'-O-)-methyltransferase
MSIPNKPLLNMVLVEPEIPSNSGNVGRSCVAMNCHLHLVGPMGFEITDARVKRAGLDYWPHLEMTQYNNFSSFEKQVSPDQKFYFFTTKSTRSFYDVQYHPGDWLVFGPETRGLSADILQKYSSQAVTIPMIGKTRSLNLSNAAAIAIYEAYRQIKQ